MCGCGDYWPAMAAAEIIGRQW
ncbi:hypothetical protein A2U01_0112724, partial [Trifolium medium]|nr:hypothetical protein [Trifolium medium]